MEKSGSPDAGLRLRIVSEEMLRFNQLIEGHRKLLVAIGEL